uniref:SCO2400 family protein n=1 Tax=Streptomyces prasinus TaxID=67345 RepID=UPI003B976D62
MDYCHPCRRHLNGALACPGCGTPAETLPARPEASDASRTAHGDDPSEPEPDPEPGPRPDRGYEGYAASPGQPPGAGG